MKFSSLVIAHENMMGLTRFAEGGRTYELAEHDKSSKLNVPNLLIRNHVMLQVISVLELYILI